MDKMEYSKEFKDLIIKHENSKEFIGAGNPNAEILIIGKESSFDRKIDLDNYIYRIAEEPNWELWNKNILHPEITPESIPEWKEMNENWGRLHPEMTLVTIRKWNPDSNVYYDSQYPYNPLYPFKGGLITKLKGNCTWKNYQKIINLVYPEKASTEQTDFHQYSFITEFNDIVSKCSNHSVGVEQSIERRCNNLFPDPFFKSFPIVIVACGHYVRDYQIDLESIFDQKFNKIVEVNKGEWINVHEKDGRILIHTRQLSMCSGKLLETIADYCKDYKNRI